MSCFTNANILSSELGEQQIKTSGPEVEGLGECEDEILFVSPLASIKQMSINKDDVDMEWLVTNFKELLAVVVCLWLVESK